MDALADSSMPVRMIERRGLRLQQELQRIDAELGAMPADTAVESVQWGVALAWPFDMADEPELRAWLMTLMEEVTVQPAARGTNRFDPSRVAIAWRDGVVSVA
jgi:hypothetical protein